MNLAFHPAVAPGNPADRRRARGPARAAFLALAALALAVGACDGKPKAPLQVLFSPDVYDCAVSYSAVEAAFRADFAFTTARDEERFELRIVEPPRLSDQWPETLPAVGWERLFVGGLAEPFVFLQNPAAAPGSTYGPFGLARPWSYDGLFKDASYYGNVSVLESVGVSGRTPEEAVRHALLAALSIGAGCPDLEAAPPMEPEARIRRAEVGNWQLLIESRTGLDAAGLVEARALYLRPRNAGQLDPLSDGLPRIRVEIVRRGSELPGALSFDDPWRDPHQRRTGRGWFPPVIDGSTATIPLTRSVYASLFGIPESEAEALVRHNKTHQAFVNVVEGKADLAFVTEPSPAELEYARSAGVELSIVPVAREAFVFLVNAANPIESLRLEELRSIYRGEYSEWQELDPSHQWYSPIAAYTRPPDSGSQTLFEKLVLPAGEIRYRELVEEGMGELVLSVAGVREPEPGSEEDEAAAIATISRPDRDYGTLGGLGYSFYFYLSEMMANPDVKLLAVDGVFPSEETIVDASYPLLTAYYAVTRAGTGQSESARYLLDWLGTRDGEKALRAANYIPWASRSAGR